MHQAIHIFRKDVRRLRYEITVLLLLNVAFSWLAGRAVEPRTVISTFEGLLAVGWAYVSALLFFGEPLAGTKQFWLTRPYRLPSLLLAKAIFAVTFFFVPILLQDVAILAAQGFSPWLFARDILVHSLELTAVWTLPVMAIAAVTTGLAQCIFAMVLVFVEVVVVTAFASPVYGTWQSPVGDHMQWILTLFRVALILASALLVLAVTYRWRWILAARIFAIAAVFFICTIETRQLLPVGWVMSIQRAVSPAPDVPGFQIRISQDPIHFKDRADEHGPRGLSLWIDFPRNMQAPMWLDLAQATITLANGRRYQLWSRIGYTGFFPVYDPSARLEGPATLDLRVLATIRDSDPAHSVPATGNEYLSSGLRCRADDRRLDVDRVLCRAPFNMPFIGSLNQPSRSSTVESYEPVPMSFRVSPVAWREGFWARANYYERGATVRMPRPASITPSRIVAHVIREIRGAHIVIQPMPTVFRGTIR